MVFQIQATAYEMSELSDKALIVRKMQALYCIIPTRDFFFRISLRYYSRYYFYM